MESTHTDKQKTILGFLKREKLSNFATITLAEKGILCKSLQ